jgi:hypothetical protein
MVAQNDLEKSDMFKGGAELEYVCSRIPTRASELARRWRWPGNQTTRNPRKVQFQLRKCVLWLCLLQYDSVNGVIRAATMISDSLANFTLSLLFSLQLSGVYVL